MSDLFDFALIAQREPAGRAPADRLLSPLDQIATALDAMQADAEAIDALLDAPVLLNAHRDRLRHAARQIAANSARSLAHLRIAMRSAGRNGGEA